MFANTLQPTGCDYRITPSCAETAAGRASAPPKLPALVTRTQRCASTWRVRGDGFAIRRDDSHLEIIVDGPKKTPRHEARGAVRACEDTDAANRTVPTSIRQAAWWGQQACSCRGDGKCLCCRRFDRAIRAHQARVAAAGGC